MPPFCLSTGLFVSGPFQPSAAQQTRLFGSHFSLSGCSFCASLSAQTGIHLWSVSSMGLYYVDRLLSLSESYNAPLALPQPQPSADERMSLCARVCMFICTHCLSVHGGGQRTASRVIPLALSTIVLYCIVLYGIIFLHFGHRVYYYIRSSSRVGWLTSKPLGSTRLPPRARIPCACHHFWLLLHGFWEPNSSPFNCIASI